MEAQRAFLLQIIEGLERAGVAYAVTGSWASTSYGAPRTTHDLDIVIAIGAAQAADLATAFPPPMYADAEWMAAAAAARTFFNVIDPVSGLKADFWPLKDDAYSRSQFERRRRQRLLDHQIWMLAPEDVILAKLLWYRASESETQLRDCVGIWKAQGETLDRAYLQQWAARLNIGDLLERVTRA
jgi:hypothetical protein